MSIIIVGVGPAEFDGESTISHEFESNDWHRLTRFVFYVLIFFFSPVFFSSSAMVELDGDEVRISSRGRYAERDIVQVHAVLTEIKHETTSRIVH